jgi:hypothetical protein
MTTVFLEAPGRTTVFLEGPVRCQMMPGTTRRFSFKAFILWNEDAVVHYT